LLAKRDEAGIGMVEGTWNRGTDCFIRGIGRACDQQRGAAGHDLAGDRGNLGWRLAKAKDDFRKTLADGAMVIDASKPQIRVGLRAHRLEQPLLRGGRIESAGRHLIDQILELFV
jgi:hypothetical protein